MDYKHIAIVNTTIQVAEDRWTYTFKALEIKPETTVKEIIDWAQKFSPVEPIQITKIEVNGQDAGTAY